jgi:competence protein ComEC
MAEQGTTPGGRRGYAGTWPPRTAVPAGGFAPSRPAIWPPLIETLRRWVRAEAGAGRLLPWVPIAFGTGIAFYFAADHEPVLAVAAIAAIALCATAFLLRRHKVFPIAVMIAHSARALRWRPGGRADRPWRAGATDAPVQLGFVETRDIRERTDRFVLRVVTDGKSALADQTRARAVVC